MAQQIKRFGPLALFIGLLTVVLIVPLVHSDPPPVPDPTPEQAVLAAELRAAIGFGPTDVMPSMATDAEHEEVLDEAIVFTASIESMATELVDAKRAAEQELIHALTWGEEEAVIDDAAADVDEAEDDLKIAAQSLMPVLENEISAVDTQLCLTVDSNLELDPSLRGLTLTATQRTDLVAAHRERDRVYGNALNWHKRAVLESADATLEQAIVAVLTTEQMNELTAARATIDARLDAMLTNEGEVAGE